MNIANYSILVVEDTAEYELLIKASIGESPRYKYARNVKEAKALLAENKFDLVILDIILPDGSGYDILMQLTQSNGSLQVPTIITSGKGETSDKVMGFKSGALDYIVKPFNPIEFRARIENKLNFVSQIGKSSNITSTGNLQLDAACLKTLIDNNEIDLSPLEFKLLKFFTESVDQVFSRDQLLGRVWGENTYVLDRTVDSTIAGLRKKTDSWNYKIRSVYGMGYKLEKKAA